MITKTNGTQKSWVDKETEFAGEFEKFIGKLLNKEWDQGCICWTYNTIPEKYTLPLHGRQWIQVGSQIDSIRYNTNFYKNLLVRLDTKECKEFRFFVHSVQQTTTRI